ncbi:MAG: hypothetical protein ACI82A_002743 [Candidatus Azotimanducaceae bacterium]|jgi:hypothetical protein
MATVGLKGIWGLEQLDKTGIATWKLGLMLMGVAAPVGYVLSMLISGMEPNPVLPSISPQAITAITFGFAFITAGTVVSLLAFARSIETDLQALALFDSVIDVSIARLRPKRALRGTCVVLGLLLGCLLFPILASHGPQLNLTVIEAFLAYAAGGPYMIVGFIIMPIQGLLMGACWAVGISQINSLIHAARHIKIDFLQLSDYAAIANPGVRLSIYFISLLSAFPLMILYADDPATNAMLMRVLPIIVFLAVGVLLPHAYPVWILKNRIRDKKTAEMGQITRALRGDKEAVKTIDIHALDAPTTAADLLTHRMFLDSLWDWPIASHVQKLILFGLLPPLTWVVAAMIENAMY